MISADFYPNDVTLTNPTRQYTRVIDNLTIGELSGAYYLGWLSWDNFPQCWHFGNYAVTSSSFIFNDDTEPQNVNIGYLSSYRVGGGGAMYAGAYTKNDNGDIAKVSFSNTAYEDGRYINKLDVMGVGIYQYYFWFNQHVRYGTNGVFSYFGQNLRVQKTWDISNYLSFINGESTTDIIWNIPNVGNVTVTLNISDIQDDNVWHFSGTQNGYDYEMDVYIAGFSATQTADTTPTGTNGGGPSMVKSCYTITDNDNVYLMHLAADNPMETFNRNYILINNGTINDSGSAIFNGRTFGGYVGNYPKSFVSSNQTYNYMFDGNTCLAKVASTNSAYIFRVLSISEITTVISLQCRSLVGTQNKYGYTENDVYATYVTENNEFTATLITGDLTDDEFKSKLRPWQYDVDEWAENVYTESDLPPYDGGGSDDTDSGGDDIRADDWDFTPVSAANNFITLYGLNYKTLSDFGKRMWASLSDAAFWQMVGTAFTNDFSINPADMMKYFVSLRFFPFDLSELSNTTASGIYIGRAATPITPTTGQDIPYPIRLSNNIAQLSGGRLTIRRYYNDFRDYEPCTTVQIHVPFCGSVDVPASEVMGHEMDLTYKIDLQTGAMLAVLGVASNTYYVIATLAGTCGASIPITANNNIEFLQRIATVGSGLIGGGVSGAVKGATVGGEVGAVVGAVAGTVGGGVGALAGLPPVTVHKQGNASGFANLGGVPYAYATVQRGRFERPANYGHTTGFACDFSATLGSLSGFTVCDNVDTSGLTCNADERDEIKRLLESGVYV